MVKKDVSTWMKNISDSAYISTSTLPGTHDSHATRDKVSPPAEAKWGTTQDEAIWRQLQIGVRYLDLRLGNPNFSMRHGLAELFGNLDGVLSDILNFLA